MFWSFKKWQLRGSFGNFFLLDSIIYYTYNKLESCLVLYNENNCSNDEFKPWKCIINTLTIMISIIICQSNNQYVVDEQYTIKYHWHSITWIFFDKWWFWSVGRVYKYVLSISISYSIIRIMWRGVKASSQSYIFVGWHNFKILIANISSIDCKQIHIAIIFVIILSNLLITR